MWQLRPAAERGHFNHGWLDTHHTFSFAGYRDPRWMGFRSLRVINEDRVDAGRGFGTHGHEDMEIFSLVLAGQLEHGDSMGNGAVLTPGEFQYMSAGSGVRHSERNPSDADPVHFYQIWIEPSEAGLPPRYDQRKLADRPGWQTLAAPDGRDESMTVRQDAVLRYGVFSEAAEIEVAAGRGAWVQIVSGRGSLEGTAFGPGDGLFTETAGTSTLTADGPVVALWFDLA